MKLLLLLASVLAVASAAAPAIKPPTDPASQRWLETLTSSTIHLYVKRSEGPGGLPLLDLDEQRLAKDGFPADVIAYLRASTDSANDMASKAAKTAAGGPAGTSAGPRRALAATCSNSNIDCLLAKLRAKISSAIGVLRPYIPAGLGRMLNDSVPNGRFISYVSWYIATYRVYYVGRATALMTEAVKYAVKAVIGAASWATWGIVLVYTAIPALVFWLTTVQSY
jgi:hypothetical protein